jgi:sulfite exporter TauE/SafE
MTPNLPLTIIGNALKLALQVPRKHKLKATITLLVFGLAYLAIDRLPAIMHEAPAAMHELPAIIRAAKELPAPPIQADTTKLTALR